MSNPRSTQTHQCTDGAVGCCRRPPGASHQKLLQLWPKPSRYQLLTCKHSRQCSIHVCGAFTLLSPHATAASPVACDVCGVCAVPTEPDAPDCHLSPRMQAGSSKKAGMTADQVAIIARLKANNAQLNLRPELQGEPMSEALV